MIRIGHQPTAPRRPWLRVLDAIDTVAHAAFFTLAGTLLAYLVVTTEALR